MGKLRNTFLKQLEYQCYEVGGGISEPLCQSIWLQGVNEYPSHLEAEMRKKEQLKAQNPF